MKTMSFPLPRIREDTNKTRTIINSHLRPLFSCLDISTPSTSPPRTHFSPTFLLYCTLWIHHTILKTETYLQPCSLWGLEQDWIEVKRIFPPAAHAALTMWSCCESDTVHELMHYPTSHSSKPFKITINILILEMKRRNLWKFSV